MQACPGCIPVLDENTLILFFTLLYGAAYFLEDKTPAFFVLQKNSITSCLYKQRPIQLVWMSIA
jgi:hypothetical protein